MELDVRRRFFAEEIEAVARLQSAALVEALAAVPRERFLPEGPWTILAESDVGSGAPRTRQTSDADPARVLHNIAVAILPERQLFNGQPSTIGAWIDALGVGPGSRVLHVGCGTGYYTALMAHCAGAAGRVLAFEADAALAAAARRNLAAMGVEVRDGSDADPGGGVFDAILVNAGVTHPLDAWLDALAPGGRMLLPLTSTMVPMGSVGKGLALVVTRTADAFSASVAGVVAIFSATGLRDPELNERVGRALMGGPQKWGAISRLRRDAHEPVPSCWLHAPSFCLSA